MLGSKELDDFDALRDEAEIVRQRAYCPYSNFSVGAALQTRSGKVFVGCNVENRSLGLTMCAEQGAVAAAVAAGHGDFVRLVIVTGASEPTVPCGRCRQILAEFNSHLQIVTATTGGRRETYSLTDLLPRSQQGILNVE